MQVRPVTFDDDHACIARHADVVPHPGRDVVGDSGRHAHAFERDALIADLGGHQHGRSRKQDECLVGLPVHLDIDHVVQAVARKIVELGDLPTLADQEGVVPLRLVIIPFDHRFRPLKSATAR